MPTIYKLPTFKCPFCPYHQDFPMTLENVKKHFTDIQTSDPAILVGYCPACLLDTCKCTDPHNGSHWHLLENETDPAKQTTITICDVADIEQRDISNEEKKVLKQQRLDDLAKFSILAV